jgi:hypothetical protein
LTVATKGIGPTLAISKPILEIFLRIHIACIAILSYQIWINWVQSECRSHLPGQLACLKIQNNGNNAKENGIHLLLVYIIFCAVISITHYLISIT